MKEHAAEVIQYYDTHPINEDEILAKLAARGDNIAQLSEDDLKDFDQDHYGGTEMVDLLAQRAGIRREHYVLDVCSGMGGPARWIAHRIGCRVTGIDFTQSRVAAALRLTRRVGLAHLVDFVQGDATAMPLRDATYDTIISQEAWLHIPDKAALIGECSRVAKPFAVLAFTDTIVRAELSTQEQQRLALEMKAPFIAPVQRYLDLLKASGWKVERCEDLSGDWREVLARRLEMYRSLRETTVAKFGATRFLEWDRIYSYYVGLFAAGKLGGVRVVARLCRSGREHD